MKSKLILLLKLMSGRRGRTLHGADCVARGAHQVHGRSVHAIQTRVGQQRGRMQAGGATVESQNGHC